MPGNSLGIYGGFASHIPVPSLDLCEIKNRDDIPLSHLAVVADAATTPFQALKRAELEPGDCVVVIGIGGVGQYLVQEAKALGAGTIIAIDIVQERLDEMLRFGADFVVNAAGKVVDTVRGFKMLISGELDHLPEQAFLYVGTIEEAIEKAERLKAEV